jgi:hypothetical protein
MADAVSNRFHYLVLWLGLLGLPTRVLAHQLDEYLQATLVGIEPGAIRLQINLTPGVAVAERVLGLIDQNHDGVISTSESAAYAELLKRDLSVRLDGRNLQLNLVALNLPEPGELHTGWGVIQMEFSVTPGAFAGGPHRFILENRHLPGVSVYLFNATQPGAASVQITGQKRNENQSTGEIAFEFHPAPNPSLTVAIVVSLAALFVFLFASMCHVSRKQRVIS